MTKENLLCGHKQPTPMCAGCSYHFKTQCGAVCNGPEDCPEHPEPKSECCGAELVLCNDHLCCEAHCKKCGSQMVFATGGVTKIPKEGYKEGIKKGESWCRGYQQGVKEQKEFSDVQCEGLCANAVIGERERVTNRIGFLRQWLNEKDANRMVTNEDIKTWLEL